MDGSYVECGGNVCYGSTAHCCVYDPTVCCWTKWYNWYWGLVAMFITVALAAMMVAWCVRKHLDSPRRTQYGFSEPLLDNRRVYGALTTSYITALGPLRIPVRVHVPPEEVHELHPDRKFSV